MGLLPDSAQSSFSGGGRPAQGVGRGWCSTPGGAGPVPVLRWRRGRVRPRWAARRWVPDGNGKSATNAPSPERPQSRSPALATKAAPTATATPRPRVESGTSSERVGRRIMLPSPVAKDVNTADTDSWRCQVVVWPAKQLGAEHCGVQGEALRGIGGIVPGERLDSGESVRDRADREVQAAGGFGGDGAGGEVFVERAQEWFGSAASVG